MIDVPPELSIDDVGSLWLARSLTCRTVRRADAPVSGRLLTMSRERRIRRWVRGSIAAVLVLSGLIWLEPDQSACLLLLVVVTLTALRLAAPRGWDLQAKRAMSAVVALLCGRHHREQRAAVVASRGHGAVARSASVPRGHHGGLPPRREAIGPGPIGWVVWAKLRRLLRVSAVLLAWLITWRESGDLVAALGAGTGRRRDCGTLAIDLVSRWYVVSTPLVGGTSGWWAIGMISLVVALSHRRIRPPRRSVGLPLGAAVARHPVLRLRIGVSIAGCATVIGRARNSVARRPFVLPAPEPRASDCGSPGCASNGTISRARSTHWPRRGSRMTFRSAAAGPAPPRGGPDADGPAGCCAGRASLRGPGSPAGRPRPRCAGRPCRCRGARPRGTLRGGCSPGSAGCRVVPPPSRPRRTVQVRTSAGIVFWQLDQLDRAVEVIDESLAIVMSVRWLRQYFNITGIGRGDEELVFSGESVLLVEWTRRQVLELQIRLDPRFGSARSTRCGTTRAVHDLEMYGVMLDMGGAGLERRRCGSVDGPGARVRPVARRRR